MFFLSRFQIIIPKDFKPAPHKPVVIHYGGQAGAAFGRSVAMVTKLFRLLGTGDQYYWRRRALVAKPLLFDYSMASIILENPFYGYRKPKDQE